MDKAEELKQAKEIAERIFGGLHARVTVENAAKEIYEYAQQRERETAVDFYISHLNYPIDRMHILKEFNEWKSNQNESKGSKK